jgi:hypothetical protein
MRGRENTSLQDRLKATADAKKALLERARALNPANDPAFAERQKARLEAAALRDAREVERREEKKKQQAEAEAARLIAEKADAERRAVEAVEAEARKAALLIEQKAARDARYAARKSRQDKKR